MPSPMVSVSLSFAGPHMAPRSLNHVGRFRGTRLTAEYRLATTAFRTILGKKQSRYGEVLAWLDVAIGQSAARNRKEAYRLNRVAKQGEIAFRGYKF